MKKTAIILLNIGLWLVVYSLFYHKNVNEMVAAGNDFSAFPLLNLLNPLLMTFGYSLPFYFGYFTIPYFIHREKWVKIFILVSTIAFFFTFGLGFFYHGSTTNILVGIIFMLSSLCLFTILGVGFRSLFGWIDQKRRTEKLELQNNRSELALLRSQLNPHLLFNTLHAIDRLIFDNQKAASGSLIKLSDIMRYMLREAKEDLVPVSKELSYIENYLDLEGIRFKNPKFLKYSTDGDFSQMKIAPMLFIPFIENAFKHGIDSNCEEGVSIVIKRIGGSISFSCRNSIQKSITEKDQTSGIGLNTVKKRLAMIYPHSHHLEIKQDSAYFMVELEIRLHED
ncbi:MAG: histidine kinase [Bacteroidales bacterium]|nr:histidine kinase [Bacteroidales bacterium]